MRIRVPGSREAPQEPSPPLPPVPVERGPFDVELDRLNRDALASALEDCVFLVGRLETLCAQSALPSSDRRRLRRLCNRLAAAVGSLDDELFDPSPAPSLRRPPSTGDRV